MNIYPIRMSKKIWPISFYSIHNCSPSCALTIDPTDNISLIVNPSFKDGKCSLYKKLIYDVINLSEFNIHYPSTQSGLLYNPDQIVIPDSKFVMFLQFPFTRPSDINIEKENGGFSLREIINIIKLSYKKIYEMELQTATPITFRINKECECFSTSLLDYINEKEMDTDNKQDCSICYTPYNDKSVKLTCNHEFHKICLQNWIDKGQGKTCPLCRTYIMHCNICNNTRFISSTLQSVELPNEFRHQYIRNVTNGSWGIGCYYFEQLILNKMVYNSFLKRLQVSISSNIHY